MSRRAARVQRERDAQRALALTNGSDADAGVRAEAAEIARREPLPHTVPLPIIDLTVAPPAPAELPLRSSGRRRTSTGPTPIRVGARGAALAATRRAAKTAQLMAPPAPPARHARAARTARPGIVAGLAVIVSLVLASTATVTAALSGPALYGVAEGRVAACSDRRVSAAAAQASVPLPASVEALPAPTIEAAPAAIELCSIPAFADALAAGDDAAAIAAAGGADVFRTAVAGGTAPCVALDDPARVWVVLNKTRPNDAAGLSAGGARDARRGAKHRGRIPARGCRRRPLRDGRCVRALPGRVRSLCESGFRSYETQQTTYGSQVRRAGRRGGRPHRARARASASTSPDSPQMSSRARAAAERSTISPRRRRANGSSRTRGSTAGSPATRTDTPPITGYSPEPWHLRYIGPELARAYHDGGWHTLEEFFGLPAAPTYL